MKWLICGTIPDSNFPLMLDTWKINEEKQSYFLENSQSMKLSIQRGTPALMATTALACQKFGITNLQSLLVGDCGEGKGSKLLYDYLAEILEKEHFDGITFHYLFPDVDGHNKVLMACQALEHKPILVADAGFMYVAKMSGYADEYDLFTPDIGEMAFLADEFAPHPFYTRGFLLAEEKDIPLLLERGKTHNNIAKYMIIKGKIDYIVENGNIVQTITTPSIPAMEAIGGTGDLVTGLVTAGLMNKMPIKEACLYAAQKARDMAKAAMPNPATQVNQILRFL